VKPRINKGAFKVKDFASGYTELYPRGTTLYVDQLLFVKIVLLFYKLAVAKLVTKPVKLGLGFLNGSIRGGKSKEIIGKFRYDYKETAETGKPVYFEKSSIDGYTPTFIWAKADVGLTNKSLYALVMTRVNRRKLSETFYDKYRTFDFKE